MLAERCLRCGRVAVLRDWPLRRYPVYGFATAAVWAMGWRACPRCVGLVEAIVAGLEPVAP